MGGGGKNDWTVKIIRVGSRSSFARVCFYFGPLTPLFQDRVVRGKNLMEVVVLGVVRARGDSYGTPNHVA